jgi:hypothetical protein
VLASTVASSVREKAGKLLLTPGIGGQTMRPMNRCDRCPICAVCEDDEFPIAADCETMLDIVRVVKKHVSKEMNDNNDH